MLSRQSKGLGKATEPYLWYTETISSLASTILVFRAPMMVSFTISGHLLPSQPYRFLVHRLQLALTDLKHERPVGPSFASLSFASLASPCEKKHAYVSLWYLMHCLRHMGEQSWGLCVKLLSQASEFSDSGINKTSLIYLTSLLCMLVKPGMYITGLLAQQKSDRFLQEASFHNNWKHRSLWMRRQSSGARNKGWGALALAAGVFLGA